MKNNKKIQSQDDISQIQAEVLNLVSHDCNQAKQIAKARRRSVRATYKVLNNLINKGFLRKTGTIYRLSQRVQNFSLCPEKGSKLVRLHDVKIRVKILYPKQFSLEKTKILLLDHFKTKTIQLRNNQQVIFNLNQIKCIITTKSVIFVMPSIIEANPLIAVSEMMEALFSVIPKVENLLKVTLIKDQYCNIDFLSQHCALIENGLAKLYNKEGKKFLVRDPEDNKIRFVIDNSFNLNEFEATHPKKAISDAESIHPFFLGIAEKSPGDVKDFLNTPSHITELSNSVREFVDSSKGINLSFKENLLRVNEEMIDVIKKSELTNQQILYHLESMRGLNPRFDIPDYLG
jgi:hypothetical protein